MAEQEGMSDKGWQLQVGDRTAHYIAEDATVEIVLLGGEKRATKVTLCGHVRVFDGNFDPCLNPDECGCTACWNRLVDRLRSENAALRADGRDREEDIIALERERNELKAEADRYREANESVRVCAQHVEAVTDDGPCLICENAVLRGKVRGLKGRAKLLGQQRDELKARLDELEAGERRRILGRVRIHLRKRCTPDLCDPEAHGAVTHIIDPLLEELNR